VKWYRPCGFGEKDIALWISLENVLWYSESTQEGISARGRIDPRLYILDQEPYGVERSTPIPMYSTSTTRRE
jgi:hypothetical protein